MKIKKFNESNKILRPVHVTKDEDGHWFVIPIELKKEFNEDLYNENFIDSGKFDKKYGQYRIGGDLNLVQLYAKI